MDGSAQWIEVWVWDWLECSSTSLARKSFPGIWLCRVESWSSHCDGLQCWFAWSGDTSQSHQDWNTSRNFTSWDSICALCQDGGWTSFPAHLIVSDFESENIAAINVYREQYVRSNDTCDADVVDLAVLATGEYNHSWQWDHDSYWTVWPQFVLMSGMDTGDCSCARFCDGKEKGFHWRERSARLPRGQIPTAYTTES